MKAKLSICFSVLLFLFTACCVDDSKTVNFYKSQPSNPAVIGTWEQIRKEDIGYYVSVLKFTSSGEYYKAFYFQEKKKASDPNFYHDAYFYTDDQKIYFYHRAQPVGKAAYEKSHEYGINADGDLYIYNKGNIYKKTAD